ncbi:MAG: TetR/AcrR family transcriptional regulator [Luteibaculum sp.]
MTSSPRKSKEKAIRKSEILAAAEKVFFKNGLSSASMDAVAQEANVSKGTLYLYFKNKNALYRAILRRAFETLHSLLNNYVKPETQTGKEQIVEAGRAYVKFSKEYPGYFDAILHYENDTVGLDNVESESLKSMIAGNQVLELLASCVKRGQEDGTVNSKLHPLKQALILWGTITGILQMLYAKNQLIHQYYGIGVEEILDDYFAGIQENL